MKSIQKQIAKNRTMQPTNADFNKLILEAQAGSLLARNQLVVLNLGLVVSITNKKLYESIRKDFEDYFQEGCIGLMKAIERFKPDLGYAFSTYATHWIEQAIDRYRMDSNRMIRIPVYAHEAKSCYNKLTELHPEKEHEEIVAMVKVEKNVSADTLEEILRADKFAHTSLHQEGSDDNYVVELPDEGDIKQYLMYLDLDYLLTTLTFREYRIITKRLQGIPNIVIAEEEGLCRESIRQIVEKAVNNMRMIDRLRKP